MSLGDISLVLCGVPPERENALASSRRSHGALTPGIAFRGFAPGFHPGLVCGAPLGHLEILLGHYTPGFHPGLVCDAPLGH